MDDPRRLYTAAREARTRDVAHAEARSRAVSAARLAIAVAVVVLLVGIVWGKWPAGAASAAGWALGGLVLAFVALVFVHAAVHRRRDHAVAALRFHERGLARLDDAWQAFPSTGARFDREDHPYADDLDVFGRASLFQLIDATETRFGEERLAAWLGGAERPSIDALRARQAAVRELAPRLEFREEMAALGVLSSEGKPDPEPFLAWAEGAAPMPRSALLTIAARLLPVVTIALWLAGPSLGVGRRPGLAALAVEIVILLATSRWVAPVTFAASTREGALSRYGDMLARIERASFEAPVLRAAQAKLTKNGGATAEMARLRRILGFLDARQNEVWRFFIGPVLLWDLNCALSLETWRARVGPNVRAWLEALAEIEALSSLAGFTFERPDHAWPDVVDDPKLEATALGHPLLSAKRRVANDVALHGRGEALVVTGSNMSGKSTLLRAMGANAVLAMAGAPVCAKRLVLGPVSVVTSMRVRDSLDEGVSRFYAEVRKLKRVIDEARSGRPTLFLLDEILHGTNSRERLIGARAIVRELLACGALGAVSTHDLAIGDLEESLPGKVTNVHFEEQVSGDTMTFDYRLRAGVVQSSNALRIMRMVGIDVVDASS